MPQKKGFDSEKYLQEQSRHILSRAENSGGKLYLEFGGKLVFDYHAARVLPGFDPNAKIRLLQNLKDKTDIVLCVYSGDIEQKKIRADFGITYDVDTLRLIDDLRKWGLNVLAVVITRFNHQPVVQQFRNRLKRRGIQTYTHHEIPGYPTNIDIIASDKGFGSAPYIETNRPIVVVAAPGPGSGKMATCLSQLYHDYKKGFQSTYAKFETFPIWNLPLKHPVNLAYEAATADISDFNMIDSFHLEAYGEEAVNYNRDVEAFPVLKRILEHITGKDSVYQSPTDMGVNRSGFAITDDSAVRDAAVQEIIRRSFRYQCEYAMGFTKKDAVTRVKLLMEEVNVSPMDRKVVKPAFEAAEDAKNENKGRDGIYCGAAIELNDGTIIKGQNSPLMHASSSLILNAVKKLAGIPDQMHLLNSNIMDSISDLKEKILNRRNPSLDLGETLIALSVSSTVNPAAAHAVEQLGQLHDTEMHITHIPTPGDEAGLKRLGINVTSEPHFASKDLFIT
ncbi:MAG: DUF1846 family protein [Candidatus Aminicenantes bacterium]|nr:DUF1846 family protein [Candidatus Aminicenantes bacterium]